MNLSEAYQQINDATSFLDYAKVFKELFGTVVPGQEPPVNPDSYKDENSDYGLKAKGIKAREKLNADCKEILDRVKDPKDLTRADIEVLRQYSGKGGLAEGSQYEYYTPQHVAEGCWDSLAAQGFTAGNVLDPSTGAGMFEATKNKSAIITGCDLDKTSSRIAQLLHPEEQIENKPFEQLAVETPDNTFDAVITNVPFGSARGKSQHLDPDYKSEKKIERYFILRALQKLKPGGLAVFVCPVNIVGAKDGQFAKWRTQISKIAEFMGAHKLPSKTFKDQGTDTVVDVVVFRKHPESLLSKIDSIPFDTLKSANVAWDEFISGLWWQGEGKKYIMGTYIPKVDGDRWSRETVDGDIDNASLKAKLAAKFNSRIDWAMLEDAEPVQRLYAEGDRKVMNSSEYEFTHGQWIKIVSSDKSTPIDKDKYGAATVEELRSILQDPRACMGLTAQQAFAAWKTYPNLMGSLPSQAIEFTMRQSKVEYQEQLWRGSLIGGMIGRYDASTKEGDNNEDERIALQELVAQEVMKYGHPANNKGLSVIGEDARMYGLFKSSLDVKGNYSDLLAGTMDNSGRNLQFDPTNIQSIVEYLFIREGLTTITIDDVKAMYTGGKKIETLGDLAECEEICITPDGLIMPVSRYTAGDIYPKIDAMTLAIGIETDQRIISAYQRQIEAIGKKAKITQLHEIDFTLQQKWIPKEMIRDFLKDSGHEARYGTIQKVKRVDALTGIESEVDEFVEDYSNPFGEWQIAGMSGRGYSQKVDFDKKIGGFPYNLEKYLNGKSILDHVEKDDDAKREAYMRDKKALEDGLSAYISGHPDIETVLASYNRKMNGYIPFDYDESDLGLKGVSGQVKLHTYQNAAVRRMSEEGSGILAFNVGLGKSFTALGLAKYNTQMGRSKRTCIIVPSSVLSNWYHEAKMIYGNLDHALFVGIRPEVGKDGNIQRESILDEWGQPKTGKDGKPLLQDTLKTDNDAEAVYNAMWQIPQSNYSLIVMTKDRFGQIPLKKESKDAYSELMAADLKNSAEKLAAMDKKKKKGGYAGAVEDERNEGKFSNDGTKKRGDFPFFEDMGITDVVVDEAHCFTYDTEITTIDGVFKIGDLCEKRMNTKILGMNTENGILSYQPIKAWMPKPLLKQLVEVAHDNGSFICTRDHLVWTLEAGYVEAGKLSGKHSLQILQSGVAGNQEIEDVLYTDVCEEVDNGNRTGRENVSKLRKDFLCEADSGSRTGKEVLQHGMFGSVADEFTRIEGAAQTDNDGANVAQGAQESIIIGTDDGQQSNEELGVTGENEPDLAGDRDQEPGRKREGSDRTSIDAGAGNGRGNGIHSQNTVNQISNAGVADLLQDRCGLPKMHAGGGNRRERTQGGESTGAGSEERSCITSSRVVSVTILEPSDFERLGLGDPRNIQVYDIEVAENHNFFANGVLAHNCFKNGVSASGAYDQKYYLPNTAPSNRAVDMAMKLHNLKMNNNGRGAYFLTATPITNSLNEVYTMLNHVAPRNAFTDRGIHTLDDFLATFGQFDSVAKVLASGDINNAEGLTGFKNMDGLRDLFFKYINMKDATQVEELRNSMPEAVKLTDEVDINFEQRKVYATLVDAYNDKTRPLFSIMRDMDKATTDLDLYYNRMTWHFPLSMKGNVEAMLKSLPASIKAKGKAEPGDEGYDDTKDAESQKIVETTINLADTLKTSIDGDTFVVVTHAGYEEEILGALPTHKISEEEISHPISAKYARLIENCKTEMETNGKQIIFSEEKAQHKKIVRLLVHQIPALRNKVGIINATEAKGNELQKISDAYNTGILVYIIANRKAEVGVNLQKGTTAIHHMTYPWTKASLTQREGRGVRQGNTSKKVTIYYYQAKGTIDMMRLDLIEHKGALIDDIAQGQGNRAANGEADPEMAALMFAANPEEARKKIQEQLAAKAKGEADRLKASLLAQFGAYSANMQALSTLESKRETERKELMDKITGLKADIEEYKARGAAMPEGSSGRVSASQRVQRETEALAKREAELANLDIRFDQNKTKLEGNIKRASSTLKAAANNGTLPVDASLLDHPEDVLVTADGSQVIGKGDMYEVTRYTGAISCIIKIVSVANGLAVNGVTIPYKGFKFEQLTGKPANSYSNNLPQRMSKDSNDMVTLSRFLDKNSSEPMPVRCSYSEKEIEIQQKLSQPFTDYAKLKELDKDFFAEYYNKMSFSGMYGFVGRDASGTIGLYERMAEGVTIVYPDTENENLRKAVGTAALAEKRSTTGVGYWSKNTLRTFFGANWESAIAEYGTKTTQAEVLAACEKAWKRETINDGYSERQLSEMPSSWTNGVWSVISSEVNLLGDNKEEIGSWFREFRDTTTMHLLGIREQGRVEAEKAKLDALRDHPDFKEIPEATKQAFDKLGITVKTNTGNLVMPGFKGRSTTAPAFSRWYFQDRDGKNGKLYRMREQLKGQFKAEYFADAGGEFNGSWWHVDAKTDLARIYELLA